MLTRRGSLIALHSGRSCVFRKVCHTSGLNYFELVNAAQSCTVTESGPKANERFVCERKPHLKNMVFVPA